MGLGLKDSGKSMMFDREMTMNIELLGEEKIPVYELIQTVRMLCGGLLACQNTGPQKFELTMSNVKGKERLLDGFKIGNTTVIAKKLSNDKLVVSFLNLRAYTTDEEILDKLKAWGVTVTSPIKRRMWPGTRIADGALCA